MTTTTLLIIILIVILLGGVPVWPYNRNWGWGPSAVGIIVAVFLVLLLLGRIIVAVFLVLLLLGRVHV